jgi:hypothetical protein
MGCSRRAAAHAGRYDDSAALHRLGKDDKFRSWLEQRRIGYVVAVACNQVVPGSTGTSRADVLAAHAPLIVAKARQITPTGVIG